MSKRRNLTTNCKDNFMFNVIQKFPLLLPPKPQLFKIIFDAILLSIAKWFTTAWKENPKVNNASLLG